MRNAKWVLLIVPVQILATAAVAQDARGLLQGADRAMVPIHGNPGPQADFERIVGPAVARQQSSAGTGN